MAIVWFSSTASERVGLTVIDDASRADLLTHIPTSPDGATSIGSGNYVNMPLMRLKSAVFQHDK